MRDEFPVLSQRNDVVVVLGKWAVDICCSRYLKNRSDENYVVGKKTTARNIENLGNGYCGRIQSEFILNRMDDKWNRDE